MNMDPYYLGMLVMVGTKATNKSKFKPPLAAIKERYMYYAKFRGKGRLADLEEPVGGGGLNGCTHEYTHVNS